MDIQSVVYGANQTLGHDPPSPPPGQVVHRAPKAWKALMTCWGRRTPQRMHRLSAARRGIRRVK